jgi:hypothetical protein
MAIRNKAAVQAAAANAEGDSKSTSRAGTVVVTPGTGRVVVVDVWTVVVTVVTV